LNVVPDGATRPRAHAGDAVLRQLHTGYSL